MGFPHPTGAEEQQIVSPLDPIGVLGQVGDLSWVDLSTDAEVKLTERLGGRQVGFLEISIRNLINRHISQLTLLQIGTEVIATSGYQCTALYLSSRSKKILNRLSEIRKNWIVKKSCLTNSPFRGFPQATRSAGGS